MYTVYTVNYQLILCTIKPIHLSDLSGFVVSSEQCDSFRVLCFQRQQSG